MKFLSYIKNFWIDFFVAYNRRLIKNNKGETPLTNLVHVSFVQMNNFNAIMVILLVLFFPSIRLNFLILILPFAVLAIFNIYYFYYMLDEQQRKSMVNRMPRYKTIVYDVYDICSIILFLGSLYFASKAHGYG